MIWIIIYIVGAAASVFLLCCAKLKMIEKDDWEDVPYFLAPILCSVFWPIGLPVYGAYLAALWYSKKSGRKE